MGMDCSVEDRAEIEDLLARYCFALDTKNFDDLRNVMTDDVVWDYSDEFGEPHQGVEAVIDVVRAGTHAPPGEHPCRAHDPSSVDRRRHCQRFDPRHLRERGRRRASAWQDGHHVRCLLYLAG